MLCYYFWFILTRCQSIITHGTPTPCQMAHYVNLFNTHMILTDWFGHNWTHQHYSVNSNDPWSSIRDVAQRSASLHLATPPQLQYSFHLKESGLLNMAKWTQQSCFSANWPSSHGDMLGWDLSYLDPSVRHFELFKQSCSFELIHPIVPGSRSVLHRMSLH